MKYEGRLELQNLIEWCGAEALNITLTYDSTRLFKKWALTGNGGVHVLKIETDNPTEALWEWMKQQD